MVEDMAQESLSSQKAKVNMKVIFKEGRDMDMEYSNLITR
jgi:hypothetical protein